MEGRERKYILQKQLFADFLQNKCSSKSRNIHRKLPQALRPATLLKRDSNKGAFL